MARAPGTRRAALCDAGSGLRAPTSSMTWSLTAGVGDEDLAVGIVHFHIAGRRAHDFHIAGCRAHGHRAQPHPGAVFEDAPDPLTSKCKRVTLLLALWIVSARISWPPNSTVAASGTTVRCR